MKSALPLSIFAVTVSLVVAVRSYSSTPPDRAGDLATASAATPASKLADRIDALERENSALRDRLAALELRPAASPRVSAPDDRPTRAEFEALREQLAAALGTAGRSSGSAPFDGELDTSDPGEFRERVAETLDEIRRDTAVEKFTARNEERRERLDRTMPKIDALLDLSADQSDRMRTALLTQYEREEEILRLWQDGVDDTVLGEQKADNWDAFQSDLGAVLTPEQLETYLENPIGNSGK